MLFFFCLYHIFYCRFLILFSFIFFIIFFIYIIIFLIYSVLFSLYIFSQLLLYCSWKACSRIYRVSRTVINLISLSLFLFLSTSFSHSLFTPFFFLPQAMVPRDCIEPLAAIEKEKSPSSRVRVCRLRKAVASYMSLRKGENCKPYGPSPNYRYGRGRKFSGRSVIARVYIDGHASYRVGACGWSLRRFPAGTHRWVTTRRIMAMTRES